MAEHVQEVLDQMVAPLADLMDRNIFTQSEIHAIVARRRESEYLLRRRSPRKADFLRYIQDELQLEKLRQLRTKKQQAVERERLAKLGKLQEDIMVNKKHIGDSHIIQHIHLLFRKTLRKYNKEDVSIYLQYADVCKQLKSWNKLPQVYAEAVQIHPHEPGLWIEAASHEFFHRQSVSTARVLLQRALRVNKKAKDLWLQSFALEFHHIAKMQGRRAVLQIDEKEEQDEGSSLDSPLYAIAKIVYDNAIDAIPDDVSFRLSFLDLCRTFPFTESMEAYIFETVKRDFAATPKAWIARASYVLEQQQRKEAGEDGEQSGFRVAPEGTSDDDENDGDKPAKKKRRTTPNSEHSSQRSEDPVLVILQEAIEAIPSSEMYMEAVRFSWSYWEDADEVFSDPELIGDTRRRILSFIEELLEDAAADSNVYNSAVVLEHAHYFTRLEKHEKALQVLESYVESAKDMHTAIWLHLAACTRHVKSDQAARAVLKRALKLMPLNHHDHLKLLLESLGAAIAVADGGKKQSTDNMEQVTDIFQRILLLAAGGSVAKPPADLFGTESDNSLQSTSPFGVTTVAEACLHFLMFSIRFLGPLKGVRKTCNLVLYRSNFADSGDGKAAEDMETLSAFFDKCIEVELACLKKASDKHKSEKKKDRVTLRQLYERAISLYKGNPPLAHKYRQGRNEVARL